MTPQPSERTLHSPAPRPHRKSTPPFRLAYNFQPYSCSTSAGPVTRAGHPRHTRRRPRSRATTDIVQPMSPAACGPHPDLADGCRDHDQQHQPKRLHQQLALAAADFLAWRRRSRGCHLFARPHCLAIHNRTAGLGFSAGGLPHPFPNGVVDRLPRAVPAPRPEVMIDGSPRWQIMREQLPGTATANYIEDSIDDFTACVFDRTTAWLGHRHQRLESAPFSVGQIGVIRLSGFHRASVRNTFSNAL